MRGPQEAVPCKQPNEFDIVFSQTKRRWRLGPAKARSASRLCRHNNAASISGRFPRFALSRTKNRYERRKRCGLRSIAKTKAATHETDFIGLAIYPIMEPARVGTSVREKHDQRPCLGSFETLPCPIAHCAAIRRVAKNTMSAPILLQPVLLLCEVLIALGVLARGARIERESKLRIQIVEKRLRCRPFLAAATVKGRMYRHLALHRRTSSYWHKLRL